VRMIGLAMIRTWVSRTRADCIWTIFPDTGDESGRQAREI
jgi:hypothetical protein